MKRSTHLRLRRGIRRTQHHVNTAQSQAAEHLERHVAKRWQKFSDVRRFVFGWLLLIGVLLGGVLIQMDALAEYYLSEESTRGGVYTEGVVGEIRNLNPIFATGGPDRTAATLIFDSLLTYDQNMDLTGALAESWAISKSNLVYTLKLRDNIFWHDGRPVTARDVVFTFETIQHPDTGSPLERSWLGVAVEAEGERNVKFTLPNPFTPFPHGLTRVGIIPEHILGEVPFSELRAHPFNLAPRVGNGPFTFANMNLENGVGQVRLTRFDLYYEGQPKLDEFVVHAFIDHEQMLKSLKDNAITGAADLRVSDFTQIEDDDGIRLYKPRLYNNVMLFFNNDRQPFANRMFRRALTRATDNKAIFNALDSQFPISNSALLKDQLGYSEKYEQLDYNAPVAGKLLDEMGWKVGQDGIRFKGGQPLELNVVAANSGDYPKVVEELQRQWREIGIVLKPTLLPQDELQRDHLLPHAYDMVLLGIDQGIDPDVFVYWHSSEARPGGLNLSEYENQQADAALEAGRTRTNNKLRIAKYEAFLNEWSNDSPSIALYRPTYIYTQLKGVNANIVSSVVDPVDRLIGVEDWTVFTSMERKPL